MNELDPITPEEVATVLSCVIAGECEYRFEHDRLYADGWTIDFFNDAGELDYVELAIAPDGRRANYHQLNAGPRDPLDLLGELELEELENLWNHR